MVLCVWYGGKGKKGKDPGGGQRAGEEKGTEAVQYSANGAKPKRRVGAAGGGHSKKRREGKEAAKTRGREEEPERTARGQGSPASDKEGRRGRGMEAKPKNEACMGADQKKHRGRAARVV